MKITGIKPVVHAVDVNSVTFGTVIQLIGKPEFWPEYRNWNAEKLFILTSEYCNKRPAVNSDLLIVDLDTGSAFGLVQGTQVILRKDVVAGQES